MKLPAIDFYEFVGIIVPGTVLLVAVGFLFDIKEIESLLTPEDLGSFGAHIILAYLTGHLLQGIGNGIEKVYWWLGRGMPTEWPISQPKENKHPKAIKTICKLTRQRKPSGSPKEQRQEWRRLIDRARSTIYAKGRASRLHVFNGNYGMFRGVVAALVVIALVGTQSTKIEGRILYPVLAGLTILSGYRMHRFAKHYAKELFANAAELANTEQGKK